jgi:uncharacterized protein
MKADEKLEKLSELIKSYAKVMVAFSGGVDSTFLLAFCANAIGKDNVIAATASSETYTPDELLFARVTAWYLGVKHVIIETNELEDECFSANTDQRCYYCKNHFYISLIDVARAEEVNAVLDGNNSDDVGDYRPGRKAAAEHGVLSPLMLAGLTKDDIRRHSKAMGLRSWDKPANPCLASRVPYGSRITREKLETIAQAEKFIRQLGFRTIRVRHHDDIARIEIPTQDMPRFMENATREKANRYMKSLGFTWVAVDIGGYRTGSLNEAFRAGTD